MINSKKYKKVCYDGSKHYPNKDESSLLRKLMSENNMSENEIRNIKKFRKMLSDASKKGQIQKTYFFIKRENDYIKGLVKRSCKETGLVPEHPKTREIIERNLKNDNINMFRFPLINIKSYSVNKIINIYRN
ncbi:MAG: hypothetical protein ACOC3V_03725 [bacterium]